MSAIEESRSLTVEEAKTGELNDIDKISWKVQDSISGNSINNVTECTPLQHISGKQQLSSFVDGYVTDSFSEVTLCNFKSHVSTNVNPKSSTMRRRRSDSTQLQLDYISSIPDTPQPKKQVLRYEIPVQFTIAEEQDDYEVLNLVHPYSTDGREPATPPLPKCVASASEPCFPHISSDELNSRSLSSDRITSRRNNKRTSSRLRSFSLGSPLPRIPQLLPRLRQRIRYIRFVPRQQQRLLIRANHPLKILWDVLTVMISLINAYAIHVAIGDRSIGKWHGWENFCQIWFVVDILLNFVTEHQLSSDDDRVLTDCQAVWARYLTSWFVVDLLSLVPGEALFVKPIIDEQKKRGFIKKHAFRVRNITRFLFNVVTRRQIRPKHVTMFSTVAKHSKRAGIGGPRRLIHLMIKYIPKYILFFRKMKGLVALRVLRQFHWFQKVWKNLRSFVFRKGSSAIVDGGNNFNSMPLLHKQTLVDDETLSLTCDSAEFEDEFDIDETYDVSHDDILLGSNMKRCSSTRTQIIRKRNNRGHVVLMGQGSIGNWEIVDESSSVKQNTQVDDDDFDGGYPY